ncbi:hypothetical protein Dimus_021684 [Dionaea muscipula]
MATISFIIGIIGNVISILVFSSPIGTFRRVVKKKSTENYNGLPYITTLLSTSLWTFYGLLKPGGLLVVTVNGAGTVLQFTYVTLFLTYAPRDNKVKLMKLVASLNVGFFGAVVAIALLAIHGSLRLTCVGILCAGLTVGMYASPLAVMRTVIKTKSVEYMPFSLSFFLFLNAGIWTAYATMVRDYFIGVPNAIGFVLGSVQLILYSIYNSKSSLPTRSPTVKTMEEEEEEGSAHLVKADLDVNGISRNLTKGRSLPKSSVYRQHSVPVQTTRIMKALSLGPYDLQYIQPLELAST